MMEQMGAVMFSSAMPRLRADPEAVAAETAPIISRFFDASNLGAEDVACVVVFLRSLASRLEQPKPLTLVP